MRPSRECSANDLACQGYNVRAILDRAGAIVERYAYDSYGRPLIRESCGRGDIEPLTRSATTSPAAKRANAEAFAHASRVNQDTKMSSADTSRFYDAKDANIWDPRADMEDDGDVDATDETLYLAKYGDWSGFNPPVTVAQAFSDVGNPFMFQGVPHFALDTAAAATSGKLMLNHHRARFADPVTGRWNTRDPLYYIIGVGSFDPLQLRKQLGLFRLDVRINPPHDHMYLALKSNPGSNGDPSGELIPIICAVIVAPIACGASISACNNDVNTAYNQARAAILGANLSPDVAGRSIACIDALASDDHSNCAWSCGANGPDGDYATCYPPAAGGTGPPEGGCGAGCP